MYSMTDRFFGDVFYSFVLPVLVYCYAVLCSVAHRYLKLLYRVVSGANFMTGGVFEFGNAHC